MAERSSLLRTYFESVFYGQVYSCGGRNYDVPLLTAWCKENLDVSDIPLASLTMSHSDEKHGSDEFKAHAQEVSVDEFPIVVVALDDGRLQIADGNHRAWKAAASGRDTIRGYIANQAELPESAWIGP